MMNIYKKSLRWLILCSLIMLFTGCDNKKEESKTFAVSQSKSVDEVLRNKINEDNNEESMPDLPSNINEKTKNDTSAEQEHAVDIDLTQMSGTMVYSEIFNMLEFPEEYFGKKIKMTGNLAVYTGEDNIERYACIVQDATACCSQGIEFILSDESLKVFSVPDEGTLINVIGTYGTYTNEDTMYLALLDADCKILK